jgi:hypothetical protein
LALPNDCDIARIILRDNSNQVSLEPAVRIILQRAFKKYVMAEIISGSNFHFLESRDASETPASKVPSAHRRVRLVKNRRVTVLSICLATDHWAVSLSA